MSEEQAILVERRNRVMIITLNRPDAMNAINGALSNGLWNAIQELDADDTLTAGVITGSGRAFCAGMDLKAFARGEDIGPLNEFVRKGASKPLIGAINGFALAGGCEVALTCDLLVASKAAKIGIREVKVGLFAGAGGVQRLPRQIGKKAAMEMMLTGQPIDCEKALALGLINYAVPADQLMAKAEKLAYYITQASPSAIQSTLKLYHETADYASEDAAVTAPHNIFDDLLNSNDFWEGSRAFAEKRKPKWTIKTV